MHFPSEDGYEGENIRGYYNAADRSWANKIANIEDAKLRENLWKKFISIVRRLYKIADFIELLNRAGDLELLAREVKKKVKNRSHNSFPRVYLSEIRLLTTTFVYHRDKILLFLNSESVLATAEEAIMHVVELLIKTEEFEISYFNLEEAIQLFAAYSMPIPTELRVVAQRIISNNKKRLEKNRQYFEETEQKLKANNTAIRRALKTKKG